MVIVLIHNPQAPPQQQIAMHIENGAPQQALGVLQAAQALIAQQLTAPKVFLPNGQAKIVTPTNPPTTEQE